MPDSCHPTDALHRVSYSCMCSMFHTAYIFPPLGTVNPPLSLLLSLYVYMVNFDRGFTYRRERESELYCGLSTETCSFFYFLRLYTCSIGGAIDMKNNLHFIVGNNELYLIMCILFM